MIMTTINLMEKQTMTQDFQAEQSTSTSTSTSSDKYRAELYDEMRQQAEDMGYGNIIEALTDLARIKANPVAEGLRMAAQWHQGQFSAFTRQTEQDERNYREAQANQSTVRYLNSLLSRWSASSTSAAIHNDYADELTRLADAKSAQASVALQIQPVAMDFTFRHPASCEEFTVSMSRAEIQEQISNELYTKLAAVVCDCQPVGETNVVDCGCTDYLDEFILLPVPAPKAAGFNLPNRHGVDGHYFGKRLNQLIRDFDSQTHDELARILIRLANVADDSMIRDSEFVPAVDLAEHFPILWAHADAFKSSEGGYTYHLQTKENRSPGDVEVMLVSDHLARTQKDSTQ